MAKAIEDPICIDTSSGDEPLDAVVSEDTTRRSGGDCTSGPDSTPAAGAAAFLGLLVFVLRRSARVRRR